MSALCWRKKSSASESVGMKSNGCSDESALNSHVFHFLSMSVIPLTCISKKCSLLEYKSARLSRAEHVWCNS
jgi:hypothetical protein